MNENDNRKNFTNYTESCFNIISRFRFITIIINGIQTKSCLSFNLK